jgi:hypothetical protein
MKIQRTATVTTNAMSTHNIHDGKYAPSTSRDCAPAARMLANVAEELASKSVSPRRRQSGRP